MNLRLDSKSIRIRVSQMEAKKLLQVGILEEVLCFPNGVLAVQINTGSEDRLSLRESSEPNTIRIQVPLVELEGILSLPAGTRREDQISAGNIRFEIDRFSKLNPSGAKRESRLPG